MLLNCNEITSFKMILSSGNCFCSYMQTSHCVLIVCQPTNGDLFYRQSAAQNIGVNYSCTPEVVWSHVPEFWHK